MRANLLTKEKNRKQESKTLVLLFWDSGFFVFMLGVYTKALAENKNIKFKKKKILRIN